MLALAVDVHQLLTDIPQQAHRHRPAVDAGDGAAAGANLAGQDQRFVVCLKAVLLEQRLERGLRGRLQQKQAFHLGTVGTGAHLFSADAPT